MVSKIETIALDGIRQTVNCIYDIKRKIVVSLAEVVKPAKKAKIQPSATGKERCDSPVVGIEATAATGMPILPSAWVIAKSESELRFRSTRSSLSFSIFSTHRILYHAIRTFASIISGAQRAGEGFGALATNTLHLLVRDLFYL